MNEKLSDLIASLRGQKERFVAAFARRTRFAYRGGEQAEPPSPQRSLEIELTVAREALMRQDRALRRHLAEFEAEHQRVTAEFVAVHEKNTQLVALYAAVERLQVRQPR